MHLGRTRMLLFGRVVYIHLLNPVGSLCCSSALFPYFYMVVLSITESGLLKLPMITVQPSLVLSVLASYILMISH